jgi:hypothetical protein
MLLTELETLKTRMGEKAAQYSKTFFNEVKYGIPPCQDRRNAWRKLILYLWVLSTWEQSESGDTTGYTNYISDDDFQTMISDAKRISYSYI